MDDAVDAQKAEASARMDDAVDGEAHEADGETHKAAAELSEQPCAPRVKLEGGTTASKHPSEVGIQATERPSTPTLTAAPLTPALPPTLTPEPRGRPPTSPLKHQDLQRARRPTKATVPHQLTSWF